MIKEKIDILSDEIEYKFGEFCAASICNKCKYNFRDNCRTLFTIEYLKENRNLLDEI